MSKLAHAGVGNAPFVEPGYECRLLVLYADDAAHDRAMVTAQRLATQFKDELAFAIASSPFHNLTQSATAKDVADAAVVADVLLLATYGSLPPHVDEWLTACLARRSGREGAFALLLVEPVEVGAQILALLARCNHAAVTSKMDFLALLPRAIEEMLADPAPPALLRPHPQHRPPSHWGLNE